MASALVCPKWPLFLGRRSCPPDFPLVLGLHSESDDVREVLRGVPWQAPEWYRQRHCPAELQLVCDGREGEVCEARADYPISFDLTKNRSYGMRPVFTDMIANPDFVDESHPNVDEHDPMDFLAGKEGAMYLSCLELDQGSESTYRHIVSPYRIHALVEAACSGNEDSSKR